MPEGLGERLVEITMKLAGALSPLRSGSGAWRAPFRSMRSSLSAIAGVRRPAQEWTLPLLPPLADLELGSPRVVRLNGDAGFAAVSQKLCSKIWPSVCACGSAPMAGHHPRLDPRGALLVSNT